MRIKGQSRDARELRLIFGRCPIHGILMKTIDWSPGAGGQKDRIIVECPRCHLRGDALYADGPVVLFSNHQSVLEESAKKSKTKKR